MQAVVGAVLCDGGCRHVGLVGSVLFSFWILAGRLSSVS